MDTLFVNQYYRTEEVERETYQKIFLKRPFQIVMICAIGLIFLLELILVISGEGGNVFYLVFCPVYLVMIFCLYHRNVKNSMQRVAELYGQNPLIFAEITSEQVRTFAPNGHRSEVYYYQLKKVVTTKHLILLWTNANLVHVLHKDGFAPASCEDFFHLLASKGIKIK